MPYDVTSWFENEAGTSNPTIARQFLIGTSDYTDNVIKWPKVRRSWNDVRPQAVSIDLTNEDRTFDFIRTNPTILTTECQIKLGFTHVNSGDEFITPFAGPMERSRFSKGKCTITLVDKFKALSERILGDNENSLDFTTSNYLPSDLAWYICTSHGGLSSITSTSNPDIDYADFLYWASVFSEDSVFMHALFDGKKCTEGLRKIARTTSSAIYIKGNKISFHRFSITGSYSTAIDYDHLIDSQLSIDDSEIINKQFMLADYNVSSDQFGITVFTETTSSVNSFGLREDVEEDRSVHYVDSVSALNFTQRITRLNAEPYNRYDIRTGLKLLPRQVGEAVLLTDSFYGQNGQGYRIMRQELDIEKGLIRCVLDAETMLNAFTLDVSALDSSDVLA